MAQNRITKKNIMMTNNSEQYMNMNTLMALLQHTARATVLKELKKKKNKENCK